MANKVFENKIVSKTGLFQEESLLKDKNPDLLSNRSTRALILAKSAEANLKDIHYTDS